MGRGDSRRPTRPWRAANEPAIVSHAGPKIQRAGQSDQAIERRGEKDQPTASATRLTERASVSRKALAAGERQDCANQTRRAVPRKFS